jgi:hypothetical protein
MPGFGVGEIVVLTCICGVVLVGLVVFAVLAWLLMVGQKNHSELADLDADDHPQYLTVGRGDPRYARREHNHTLAELSDVGGQAAQDGEVQVQSRGSWEPGPSVVVGDPIYARRLVRITRVAPRLFDCWFTLDAPGNQTEIEDLPLSSLQVFRETQTGPKFLSKISVESVEQVRRNQFRVHLRQESEFLRIKFDLVNIPVSGDRTLKSFALDHGLRFVGQSADHTVTAHIQVAEQ